MKRLLFVWIGVFIVIVPITVAQDGRPRDYFYTYHHHSGNRVVAGAGTFPDVRMIEVQFDDQPHWILAELVDNEPLWQVVMETGAIGTARFQGDSLLSYIFPGIRLPQGMPPVDGPFPRLFSPEDMSRLTHPIPVGSAVLYIAGNGDLVLSRGGAEVARLNMNVQPDARMVVNNGGQIAFYVDPTNERYVHGIMGDDFEGAALVVLAINANELRVVARVDLTGDEVFEGIAPIWADVDGDGTEDLITTVSSSLDGAQLRVFHADATMLANSPSIGQGFRWRHQLAWGAFGPHGEMELVDVLTPHIGGVVEFFQFDGDDLQVVAAQNGYTSHIIGSRNLDMAVAGDFNGDGRLEIVVADQARQHIAGLQRTVDGVEELWSLPLDGTLTTNLAAVTLSDGRLALAAGMDNGRVRVWLP